MRKQFTVLVMILMTLGACSQKEFSDGANGIGNDISNFGKKIFKVHE